MMSKAMQQSFERQLAKLAEKILAYDPDTMLIRSLGVLISRFHHVMLQELTYRANNGDGDDLAEYREYGLCGLKHKIHYKYDVNLWGLPVSERYPGSDRAYLIRCQYPVISCDDTLACLTDTTPTGYTVKPWLEVSEYVPDWPWVGYGG